MFGRFCALVAVVKPGQDAATKGSWNYYANSVQDEVPISVEVLSKFPVWA